MDKQKYLKQKADYIREEIIKICVRNNAGHIAPSLSCVDILVALYYSVMKYRPDNPLWEGRDRLVFSKAHGCYALYAVLADIGSLPRKEWETFYTKESCLSGCSERKAEFGIEASCGSLGHGLPIATGIAFAAKLQGKTYRTFCIVGDGELQEGSNWEALQFAVKHKMDNLFLIIDSNRLQAMDFIVNILDRKTDDLARRLKGFGLSPYVCKGHNVQRLAECISCAGSAAANGPRAIIAKTTKGFGLKCMENAPKFHFRIPTHDELSMGRSYEREE